MRACVGLFGGLPGLGGAGTVPGSAVGGLLVVYAPAGAVKLLLGCVLLGSVPGVLRGRIPRR